MAQKPPHTTPNITEEEKEEEEDSGKHSEDEEIGSNQYEIDGIKSRQLRWENGRKHYYYEVQWRGCPDTENTFERAKDIVDTATTRRWKKMADKGQPVDRQSSMNRSQINSVYAVRNKTGLMEAPLAHNSTLCRSNLLWEDVLQALSTTAERVIQVDRPNFPGPAQNLGRAEFRPNFSAGAQKLGRSSESLLAHMR